MDERRKGAVEIAKDVLARLDADKIRPRCGTYLDRNFDVKCQLKDNAQQHIDTLTDGCSMCALGALFVGYIAKYDGFTVEEMFGSYEEMFGSYNEHMADTLCKYFDRANLKRIEGAFEGWNDGNEYDDVGGFYDEYPADKDRLRAIINNIIENEGVFVPCSSKN